MTQYRRGVARTRKYTGCRTRCRTCSSVGSGAEEARASPREVGRARKGRKERAQGARRKTVGRNLDSRPHRSPPRPVIRRAEETPLSVGAGFTTAYGQSLEHVLGGQPRREPVRHFASVARPPGG